MNNYIIVTYSVLLNSFSTVKIHILLVLHFLLKHECRTRLLFVHNFKYFFMKF